MRSFMAVSYATLVTGAFPGMRAGGHPTARNALRLLRCARRRRPDLSRVASRAPLAEENPVLVEAYGDFIEALAVSLVNLERSPVLE